MVCVCVCVLLERRQATYLSGLLVCVSGRQENPDVMHFPGYILFTQNAEMSWLWCSFVGKTCLKSLYSIVVRSSVALVNKTQQHPLTSGFFLAFGSASNDFTDFKTATLTL